MLAARKLVWLMSWGGIAALACGNDAQEGALFSAGESALSAVRVKAPAGAQKDADDACSGDADCDSDEVCLAGSCEDVDDEDDQEAQACLLPGAAMLSCKAKP